MRTASIATASIAAIVLAAAPTEAATPTLSKTKAGNAIVKKVKSQYRLSLGGRDVVSDGCTRISRRRVECDYLVFKNGEDGFEEGLQGIDTGPYWASGSGTATLNPSGSVTAKVTRPDRG